MSSSSTPDHDAPRSFGWTRPLVSLLGVAVPTAALTTLTLTTASGVTRLDEFSYATELVDERWWFAAYLLVVPVFLAARSDPRLTAIGIVIAAVPQAVTAQILVDRTLQAGWGDGLESFAYVWAALMAVVFVGAGIAGALTRKKPAGANLKSS